MITIKAQFKKYNKSRVQNGRWACKSQWYSYITQQKLVFKLKTVYTERK